MELKKVELVNKGMVQDISISKNSQEFAFENHNIKIVSNDDHTSMSITNLQGPKTINTISLTGIVIGKCVLDKYVVIFTHKVSEGGGDYGYSPEEDDKNVDRIYRLDLQVSGGKESFVLHKLYEGNLNFDTEHLIDTTYYIENANVIKVYWTDGLNSPRFINIITKGERQIDESKKYFTPYTDSKDFEFYPVIDSIPVIRLEKTFEYTSLLPNGVVQYFVSYYNANGAETLIASSSNPITTDYSDRGASADDTQGGCSVIITLSNLDKTFDYVRVYSAIRTSEYGELNVRIVKDVKIGDDTIQIIDNGIDQEALDATQLFYIGGQVLIAKTLTQKDGTLFLGNLVKKNISIPTDVYYNINTAIQEYNSALYGKDIRIFSQDNILIHSPFVYFNQEKYIQTYDSNESPYYPYKRQVGTDAMSYKTFKGGEIYRFGIQFQSAQGEWTEVMWIGDAECDKRPTIHDNGGVDLNNAAMLINSLFTSEIKESLQKAGLVGYRLVMADPVKHNGRKIKAQGVLCPTLFNVKDRLLGKYAHASWVMRPRKGLISYHHLEPLIDYKSEGAEIVTNYTTDYPNVTYDSYKEGKKTYVGIVYNPTLGGEMAYKYVEFTTDYIDNNCYDYAGNVSMEVISEHEGTTGYDLKKMINEVGIPEEEQFKLPSAGFTGLHDAEVTNFITKFFTGIGMIGLSALAFFGAGPICVGISFLGAMSAAGFEALTLAISAAGLAAGVAGVTQIGGDVSYTPNYDDSLLADIIGESYSGLPSYVKDLLKTGTINRPASSSLLGNNEGNFSNYEETFPVSYDDKTWQIKTLPRVFMPSNINNSGDLYWQCYEKVTSASANVKLNNSDYFVDESVLTLHSPDIIKDSLLNPNYKCKIVGYVPIDNNNYTAAQIEMNPAPYGELGGIDYELLTIRNNNLYTHNPFYSGPLYKDVTPLNPNLYQTYRCYLFGPGDIVGLTVEELDGVPKSIVAKKQLLNHLYSKNSQYFNNTTVEEKGIYDASVKLFSNTSVMLQNVPNINLAVYEGNYNMAYTVKDMEHLPSKTTSDEMINIDFASTPHAVLTLNANDYTPKDKTPLLPIIGLNNDNTYWSFRDARVSGASWEHNVLTGDRGLTWVDNNYLDNFAYIDYFTTSSIGEARNSFKSSNIWNNYKTNNAIGVNYYASAYEVNPNTYSLESLLYPPTFTSMITEYYNQASNKIDIFYLLDKTSSTALYDYLSKNDFVWFLLNIFDKITVKGYASNAGASLLLGLIYYINSNSIVPTYVNGQAQSGTYKIPDAVTDKQVFSTIISNFRNHFKKLFMYCELWGQINDSAAQYQVAQQIQNVYQNLCSALDSLYSICKPLEEDMHREWHENPIDSYKLAKYAFAIFKDSSDAPKRTFYLAALSNDVYFSLLDIIEGIKEGILYGYKSFMRSYKKDNPCLNWRVDTASDIYSFSDNDLKNGYDNSKGYLRYKNKLYYVADNELKEVDSGDLELYYQQELDYAEPNVPYLMLAEIYNDIPYTTLYGGHTESAIRKLTWFPISETTKIGEYVTETFGDTYYQRYDCLKTYPSSEEDINQNVDITSFMVESHINLDDRIDSNRGKFNLMSRPTNFNLFNKVYNSLNDIFVYQTKQSDDITDKYPNQFVWTLSKNYLGAVDTWTNASFLSLNQCKYPITKLCNYKDKLISFNTKSIEYIDFNSKEFISSSNGFIELQNNTKVKGTVSLSDMLGTSNCSIQVTERGIYFVEDNENNIIRLNYDGTIFRIGLAKIESWMKENISLGDYTYNNQKHIHLEYDSINKELHILNDTYCLIYNESLESFTSFVDLQETMFLFSFNGKLWSFGHIENSRLYEMYGGYYNSGYDYSPVGYSIHYRVNPEINRDKVFTNVEFIADLEVNSLNSSKSDSKPFDFIRAWSEYQDTGYKPLSFTKDYPSNLKQKFRIWKADIPRDAKSKWGRDRIRNPWIHLELSKHIDPHTEDYGAKMELHNIAVQYMS